MSCHYIPLDLCLTIADWKVGTCQCSFLGGGGALPWLIPVSSYAFFSLDVSLRALGSPKSLRRVRAIECRTEVSLLKYFAGPTFYYSFFRGSISITELSLDHYNSLFTMIYDSRQCWLTLQH